MCCGNKIMQRFLQYMVIISPLASGFAPRMLRLHGHSSKWSTLITSARTRSTRGFASNTALEPVMASPNKKPRVLSGIQPTGLLHIGNYFGAIRNWVLNQDTYDNFFFVVDMHAITVPHVPEELSANTLKVAAAYLACGIDPAKSTVFVQSHVPAHAELTWLLNCITPISWLERMVQYKEKAIRQGERTCVGLFDYPVLMAADILLYKAAFVPVGEDQRQHLELARDIMRRFHDKFDSQHRSVLVEPQPLILKQGARIMSLTDGTVKMSKSAESDYSRINLLDPPELITKKIKRCKTDTFDGIEWNNPSRPEATNLLNIYQAATGRSNESIQAEVASMPWGKFKTTLADALIAHLQPIQSRYHEIIADQASLQKVLQEGAIKAREVGSSTLQAVQDAMGFLKRSP